jgi:hypothetical protein
MSFADSTFTVEINGVPTVIFRAKWHARADQIWRLWTQQHWDRLTTIGPNGLAWPPIMKVRLSHANEKAAYEDVGKSIEIVDDVKVVHLVDMTAAPWRQ